MADAAGEEKFALTSSRGFPAMAGRDRRQPRLHHLSGRQAVPARASGRTAGCRCSSAPSRAAWGWRSSADGRSLALATAVPDPALRQRPAARARPSTSGFDAVYAPHAAWVTGDLDVHDVGFGADGRPVFVNTLFACLAAVSDGHSFRPLWKPPFVSRLAAEDRCHLNGLAMEDGAPALRHRGVALGRRRRLARPARRRRRRDRRRERRDRRRRACRCRIRRGCTTAGSGCSIRAPASSAIVDLEAGTVRAGRLLPRLCARPRLRRRPCRRRPVAGAREPHLFRACRSTRRWRRATPSRAAASPSIDLASGDMTGWVRIEGVVRELYDVAVLPGVRRPSAIGFKTDEVKRVISIEE